MSDSSLKPIKSGANLKLRNPTSASMNEKLAERTRSNKRVGVQGKDNEKLNIRSASISEEDMLSNDETPTDDQSIESDINICISDTKLEQLRIKKTCQEKLKSFLGIQTPMSQSEFELKTRSLYKCCLKSVRDLHELHLRRNIGMRILDEIITRARSTYITISHVIHITWSIMSCLHHFQLRLRTGGLGIIYWARRKKTEQCMSTYARLIKIFKPEMHRILLNAIITFYREGKLWEIEFACADMIVQLLEIYQTAEEGIEDMLYTIETCTLINIHEAKYLTKVLYEILRKTKWTSMDENLIRKFLWILESSIVPQVTDNYNYLPLKNGLEICVRNLISNIRKGDLVKLLFLILKRMTAKDIDEQVMYDFGNVAAYAAKKYRLKSNKLFASSGPLPLIFDLFQCNNPVLNLMASRIWQNLVDRNNNSHKFLTPRIFFQDCNYDLNVNKCIYNDKMFFKSVRHMVFEICMDSFVGAVDRLTMENTYQAISLTLVEIPCGYTASCFVTLAMTLQEYAFQLPADDLVRSHHLHAIVLSLLTLICYIHNATVFYDYVNTIMERRAEWAPHLNPPLKAHYEYAQHHILWNKPELFFEDWEARYGLWKCFRIKATEIKQDS